MTDGEDLPEAELRPEPIRRRPSTFGGLIYLVVLTVVLVGVVITAVGRFRLGLGVMGLAMAIASAARLVLPRGEAGMLGLRPKPVDVVLLGALGAGLILLAILIPDTNR